MRTSSSPSRSLNACRVRKDRVNAAVFFVGVRLGDFNMTINSPVLREKVAVVTGASRGIGRAIAKAFAREGAAVVICGRKQETLEEVAAESGGGPGTVFPAVC